MNKISTILLYILAPFTLFANEIEILSDIPGNGPEINIHYKLDVDYIGTFEDGTVFDSSFKRNESFKFHPGASTSLHSPGCKGDAASLIRIPLILNPAGKLDNVPASNNWRSATVAVRLNPPSMCINPKP